MRKLVTDRLVHVFPGLPSRRWVGVGGGCVAIGISMHHFGGIVVGRFKCRKREVNIEKRNSLQEFC